MENSTIMVVEDDNDLSEALCDTLKLAGYNVTSAEDGEDALTLLQKKVVDLIVSDVHMKRMDGHALLTEIQKEYPQLPVMLMTAYGTIQKAVEAMQMGAVDYLVKPFEAEVLVNMVSQYLDSTKHADDDMIVESYSMKQLALTAQKVSKGNVPILITGESGTGKEVLARFIHRSSERHKEAFIAINCAAIPENMLEATLFGYEKGAFTGAYKACPGKFEQAQGGTFLLDEISEMDLALQAKLLRVLQEHEVERLGGTTTISLDVRIISTSNRNMKDEVKAGRFREDLFYRLNVFPLIIPSLVNRTDDILPICNKLIQKHSSALNMANPILSDDAKKKVLDHTWPGNIRELENVIQRALLMLSGNKITGDDILIEPELIIASNISSIDNFKNNKKDNKYDISSETKSSLGDDLKNREFDIILETLTELKGSRKKTAERLDISQRTLRYKLAKIREKGVRIPGDL
ncbi:Flagellar two-component response regulator FleR [hydrothermal vent metagenome]|uniref:Flagellar two-component response regulator FleR n=1 Tax=hydrothermal vent metagenome TaxID=652676 RepID=A0A3B0ZKZ9_9ZZZZ